MSELLMEEPQSNRLRNRRVGLFLAVVILVYIAAVIAFIIIY
jgi:hypothetical protein